MLYGGAAGGGKSDCLIAAALRWSHHPKYRGIVFRRTFPQLEEIIDRCKVLYPVVVPGAEWRVGQHRWFFPSGASVRLAHMQHADDRYSYQGHEYQFIGFDELTQFVEEQYLYLFSRARSTVPEIPVRIRSTTNPGGIGHRWVKERFQIGHHPPNVPIIEEHLLPNDTVAYLSRMFIPGKLEDNPTLLENDPLYVQRLMQLPEIERLRLMDGIWDAFEGQAFAELSESLHGFDGKLPVDWERFSVFDWGYAKPSCCYIVAVDFDGRLWVEHELYLSKPGTSDEGVRKPAIEVARMIRGWERDLGLNPKVRLSDPACFARLPAFRKGESMGPSVAEDFIAEGLPMVKAVNDRVPGRQQVHRRLATDDEGRPGMMISNDCTRLWETLPEMQEDPKNPEDLVTKDVPDHAYDCIRYACMHRPLIPKLSEKVHPNTFQEARQKMIRQRQTQERYGRNG